MSRLIDVILQAESARMKLFEILTSELKRHGIHDLNSDQAVILYRIGPAEMPVGDLTRVGCYVGTNVSYNVKKLTKAGYLDYRRPEHDRRFILIRVTEIGAKVQGLVAALLDLYEGKISNPDAIDMAMVALRRIGAVLAAGHRS